MKMIRKEGIYLYFSRIQCVFFTNYSVVLVSPWLQLLFTCNMVVYLYLPSYCNRRILSLYSISLLRGYRISTAIKDTSMTFQNQTSFSKLMSFTAPLMLHSRNSEFVLRDKIWYRLSSVFCILTIWRLLKLKT